MFAFTRLLSQWGGGEMMGTSGEEPLGGALVNSVGCIMNLANVAFNKIRSMKPGFSHLQRALVKISIRKFLLQLPHTVRFDTNVQVIHKKNTFFSTSKT